MDAALPHASTPLHPALPRIGRRFPVDGRQGSIIGTLIGCIILGTLRNGLTLLNVQAFYQLLATGIIIIVAMLIDKATTGKGE